MKRGEIYIAELKPRSGSEQTGTRPVVVVSHDGFNSVSTWRSIVVVPLTTSAAQAARGPTAVHLQQGAGGLSKDGVALCHQVTTLDRSKLTKRIGRLAAADMRRIRDGLMIALDLT